MKFALVQIAMALLLAVVAGGGCFWMSGDTLLSFAVGACVGFVAVCLVFVHDVRRSLSKLGVMVEALRNSDFSMRFFDRGKADYNRALEELAAIFKTEKMKLKANEYFYGLILDSVNAGVIAVEENGNVRLCNRQALSLLGVSVLTNEVQLDRVSEGLRHAFRTMSVGEVRLVTFPSAEGVANVSVGLSQITANDGHRINIYILNNIYSVIDRQEVDAWMKLTRVLTHEIMNGIAPINSLSDSLLHKTSAEMDDIREGLDVIRSTSDGLMRFIRSYRSFSAIPEPKKQLLYVADVARYVLSMQKRELEGMAVELAIATDDLIVNADETQLYQVLSNLLKNAVEAGAKKLRISAETDRDESVIIDVSDDAPVVDDECLQQIFVPFFTTKPEGSGIGLSVARRILNLHEGTLRLLQPSPYRHYTKTFRLQIP